MLGMLIRLLFHILFHVIGNGETWIQETENEC